MTDDQNKDDELEVTIDDVADKPVDGSAEIPVEAGKNNEGVEDWKAQFEAAQKRADEAEERAKRQADELARSERENSAARTAVVSAEMAAVDNALANVEHERSDAKAEYKAALESGDFDAAAEAQAKLSDIAIRAQRIKEGKSALERRAEEAKQQNDPVEQWVQGMEPVAANWIRAHSDLIRSDAKRSYLIAAHHKAVDRGIALNSDGYFDFIETELGLKSKPVKDPVVETTTSRTQSAPAAPPSRGGSVEAPQARSTTTVKLTPAMREIAALCGMTDAEYAKQLLAVQREGNTTH